MPGVDVTNFRFVPSIAAFPNAATVLFVISPRKPIIVAFARWVGPSCLTVWVYIRGQNQSIYDPSPSSSAAERLKSAKQRPDQ